MSCAFTFVNHATNLRGRGDFVWPGQHRRCHPMRSYPLASAYPPTARDRAFALLRYLTVQPSHRTVSWWAPETQVSWRMKRSRPPNTRSGGLAAAPIISTKATLCVFLLDRFLKEHDFSLSSNPFRLEATQNFCDIPPIMWQHQDGTVVLLLELRQSSQVTANMVGSK